MKDSLNQTDSVNAELSSSDETLGQHLYTHFCEVGLEDDVYLPEWKELIETRKELWNKFAERIHYTK